MTSQDHVTIRDVAALAGVSHQTVSRVINNDPRVSPETRARVDNAIRELGYQPNAIARFMARGESRTFACISPNLIDFTFASIIEAAQDEARQHGYFLITASAADETSFCNLLQELVESRRTDGLMVINPFADERHNFLPKTSPMVFVGDDPRGENVSAISLDDLQAGRDATDHLIWLGHRRILTITGPRRELCTNERVEGYQLALQTANIPFDPALVVEGDWSATSGYEITHRLLVEDQDFTAIFAQNDRMAVGAIRAIQEMQKRVPDDISVIGFDDMPLASYLFPPLTTMHQNMDEIGREGARLLIEAVEKPETPHQHKRIAASLVVRGSTASLLPR